MVENRTSDWLVEAGVVGGVREGHQSEEAENFGGHRYYRYDRFLPHNVEDSQH